MVSFAGEYERAIELGALAAQVTPRTAGPRYQFLVSPITLMAAAAAGEHDRARAAMEQVVDRAATLDDPRGLIWAVTALWAAPSSPVPSTMRSGRSSFRRERGLVSLLPVALGYQTTAALARNHFERARASAEEAYRLSEDIGQIWGTSALLAAMSAMKPCGATSRRRAHTARRSSPRVASAARRSWSRSRIGALARSRSSPGGPTKRPIICSGQARPAPRSRTRWSVCASFRRASRPPWPRVARPTPARHSCGTTSGSRDSRPRRTSRCGMAAYCYEAARADEYFTAALAHADAVPTMTRGRTELLFGEWLRRERRRQDARPHLRTALELFRALGAVRWEQRAAAELRATGATARKREPSTLDQLTPQEVQVADLVADGLTNREIAEQLFLSPRTIDYHLRKVFSKLGIASRAAPRRIAGPRSGGLIIRDWRFRRCSAPSSHGAQWRHGSRGTPSPLRVVLVDDRPIPRSACRALLRTEGVEVVAEFQSQRRPSRRTPGAPSGCRDRRCPAGDLRRARGGPPGGGLWVRRGADLDCRASSFGAGLHGFPFIAKADICRAALDDAIDAADAY